MFMVVTFSCQFNTIYNHMEEFQLRNCQDQVVLVMPVGGYGKTQPTLGGTIPLAGSPEVYRTEGS